jgi:hypothetical protein
MEQNLDSPVMRFQYEAEPIEELTSLSSHTRKSPKDTLASSFDGNKPVKTMPLFKVGKFLGSGAYVSQTFEIELVTNIHHTCRGQFIMRLAQMKALSSHLQ